MKKDNDLKVIEETSKIVNDIEKGFYEILANNTMRICTTYEQKLTKYKKAFEILKEVLVIPEDDDIDFYVNDRNYYKLKFTQRLINENEKELLEELIKDENPK